MSKNREPAPQAMEYTAPPPPPAVDTDQFDPGNLQDRTAELLDKEFGTRENPAQLDAVEEAILSGRPLPKQTVVAQNTGYDFGVHESDLIPEIGGLFEGEDRDYVKKQFFPQGTDDVIDTRDPMIDPKNVRVRRVAEPEDIYSKSLDPRLKNILMHFLVGRMQMAGQRGQMTMGDTICLHIMQMANGSGVPVVSWIRQKVWHYFSKRRTMDLPGTPKDRTNADEDKRDIDNIRLRMLLEWDNFEIVEEIGRTNGCSNVTAFQHMMKYGYDRGQQVFN